MMASWPENKNTVKRSSEFSQSKPGFSSITRIVVRDSFEDSASDAGAPYAWQLLRRRLKTTSEAKRLLRSGQV